MDQTIRILHLEDDPVEQELVERQLHLAGLRCKWQRVATEGEFESAILQADTTSFSAIARFPATTDGRRSSGPAPASRRCRSSY